MEATAATQGGGAGGEGRKVGPLSSVAPVSRPAERVQASPHEQHDQGGFLVEGPGAPWCARPVRCWRDTRPLKWGAHTLARPHALPSQDVSSLQVAGTRQTGEDVRSQNGEWPTQLAQSGRRRQGRHHYVCCARPSTGEVQREPRLRVWAATLSRHVRRASGASPCAASLADTPVCWLFCCDPPSQRLRRDCQHREEQPRTGGPGQGAAVTCAVAGRPRAPVPSHFRDGDPPSPLPARCLSTTWVTSPSPTTGPPS